MKLNQPQAAYKSEGVFDNAIVMKAFNTAAAAHSNQTRKDGSSVLEHLVETAMICAGIGLDATVVASALLHDILDDTNTTEGSLRAMSTPEDLVWQDICTIVVGVSRLSTVSQLHRTSEMELDSNGKESLRAMYISMADPRVCVVKLADR